MQWFCLSHRCTPCTLRTNISMKKSCSSVMKRLNLNESQPSLFVCGSFTSTRSMLEFSFHLNIRITICTVEEKS